MACKPIWLLLVCVLLLSSPPMIESGKFPSFMPTIGIVGAIHEISPEQKALRLK